MLFIFNFCGVPFRWTPKVLYTPSPEGWRIASVRWLKVQMLVFNRAAAEAFTEIYKEEHPESREA